MVARQIDRPSEAGAMYARFDLSAHLSKIGELAVRYADRKPDLADLCLIRISELHPGYPIVTVDRNDFSIFRRNKREVIPLICPP